MKVENQEMYIQCGNSKCNRFETKVIIDMDRYTVMRKWHGVKFVAYYELPHFYCSDCFWELAFCIKEKK